MRPPEDDAPDPAPPGGGSASSEARRRFSRFAWFTLAYLLAVIAFGAWVRITGSGAGCGEHWPTCHGQVVPRAPSVETRIELTHRVTSALSGVFTLALPLWARRLFGAGHPSRRYGVWASLFVVLEGAIGAGLVLRGLVGTDASVARAVSVGLHLVNTLLLTGAVALCADAAGRGGAGDALSRAMSSPGMGTEAGGAVPGSVLPTAGALAALVGVALVAATGAVTALGDTVFPVGSALAEGAAGHFLVRLRVVHPVAALVVAGALAAGAAWLTGRAPAARHWAVGLWIIVGLQVAVGALSIGLGAPGWLQLTHLLLAQVLWLWVVRAVYASRQRGAAWGTTGAERGSAGFSPTGFPRSS